MSQHNEEYIPGILSENKGLWSFMLLMGTNKEIDALSSFFEEKWGYEANGYTCNFFKDWPQLSRTNGVQCEKRPQ